MTAARGSRLEFIDGLRGIASLYVVMYHAFLLWPVSSRVPGADNLLLSVLTKVSAYGYVGVDVFLVLSGFCLTYPLLYRGTGRTQELPHLALARYARRRAWRILPPYYAAVVLFALLPLWGYWSSNVAPLPGFADLGTHALLVHNLFPSTILKIDGPLWSLALEAQLYVVFPGLIWLLRRVGIPGFFVVLLAVTLGFRLFGWFVLGADALAFEARFALMASLPARAFEFAAGMVAAVLVAQPAVVRTGRWFRAAGVVVTVVAPVAAYLFDKRAGEYSPLPPILWSLMAGGLIVLGADARFPLGRLLSWRPFVQAGIISYSIYLIHEPLLRLSGAFVRQQGWPPLLAFGVLTLVAAPGLIGLATLFYAGFERPFMRGRSNAAEVGAAGSRHGSVVLSPAGGS